jgi:alpha-glucosidase
MWWRPATFYEIYVRSFQDSNDDGIGDLNGISSRLDYLTDLGIGAIWITPFYPSPQVDFGYDVSDHEAVDPQFGTLADFDRLVAGAHRRSIKVIVDVVLNHTSDQHRWFRASRASRSSASRDWYVWRDGKSDGRPPNNWESVFGGPAWTFDPPTGQWYYHCFYSQQPDLNWRNPLVEQRMFATLKFWLDRGVDGFRLDAVNTLFEDPELRDNPQLADPKVTLPGVITQDFVHTRRLPEVHEVLRRLRGFVDRHAPTAVLISEAYVEAVEELVHFYGGGAAGNEMHLPFNFFLAQVPALDATAFRRVVEDLNGAFGGLWPSLVLSNHDIKRACDRYAGSGDTDRVARLLAMLLLTLRGTPFIYYGEEIGMRTYPPQQLEEVRDPVGRTFWPRYKGRDGSRRPMQWDGSPHAGFTRGTPWLGMAPDAQRRTVAAQLAQPGSLLEFYRSLLQIRAASDALREGEYAAVSTDPDLFAFVRQTATGRLLVIVNMAAEPRRFAAGSGQGLTTNAWQVLLGSDRSPGSSVNLEHLRLDPFEALLVGPVRL